jgi:hypothetical protein
MPRKVTIYIAPPPGDGFEKSRVWFREYVKVNEYDEQYMAQSHRTASSLFMICFSLFCTRLL